MNPDSKNLDVEMETRAFRFEREMLEPLLATLPPVLGLQTSTSNHDVTVVQTPSIGNVIPDLLIARWPGVPSGVLARLTFVEAAVLSLIESVGSLSLEQFSAHLHLTEPAASRALQRLATRSFVRTNSSGEYYLGEAANPRCCELLAVEVKLTRWRDALEQAVSYLSFANYAYVVLDGARFVARPESMNAFRSAGVGLLLQYGHFLQPVLDAKAHEPVTPDRFVALKQVSKAQRMRLSTSLQANR